ncbi:uncharacterized protein LOC129220355 isoform X3 [Uloborus diversus]|uniref:uncharacterized protein LOC129220355 isoform X3 n=1 Tax=Uloborus diversus TaxID=327109 RepID=UPI002409CC6C|nr:uncharacterized protein LOC129220355 isoform X3 [Uloborus diversus]
MNLSSSETNKQTSAENATPPETKGAESSSPDQEMETREFLHVRKEDLQWLLNEKNSGRRGSFYSDVMTPSQCRKYRWIYFRNEDIEDYDREKCGKWLLFFDRFERNKHTGLTAHDDAWQKIMTLDSFENTGVMSAKCSTALLGEPYSKDSDGVICCYSPDYTNKAQIFKAAVAIRKLVDFPRDMYFKTDAATRLKKYTWKGEENVSLYKHTTNNRLYVKDSVDSQWQLLWRF